MSAILYYSNYCNHCKRILFEASRSKVKDGIHFVCIDRRIKKNNETYVVLETQEILLPPTIQRVPTLLLLNRGNMLIEGDDVLDHVIERTQETNMKAVKVEGEPMAFGLHDFGSIISDTFSFLDQSSDELSAQGTGGMRQIHNYVPVDNVDFSIETPSETYKANTLNNDGMSLDKIREMREKDIAQPVRRM